MRHRYLVVDQNVLRKPELAELIDTQPAVRFVLPDLSFLEMTKSREWESTLQQSLQQLATVPNRVLVAYSVNEALDRELRTLQSVSGHMHHVEATKFVRDILAWVRTGISNPSVERYRKDPDDHKAAVKSDHLDHAGNKIALGRLIDSTKHFIPTEIQKRMRGATLTLEERLDIVYDIARGLVPEILASRGVNRNKSRAFLSQRPLFYRYLIVRVWYCAEWIAKGGFESLSGEDVSNEILDHQYVLTASLFDGLLSRETKVNKAYNDLLAIMRRAV